MQRLIKNMDIPTMRLLVKGAVQLRCKPSDIDGMSIVAAEFLGRKYKRHFAVVLDLTIFVLHGLKSESLESLLPLIIEL
jgi:hypothetical protein